MTRINVGILPKELPNKLLLAEHREIKRIPNCITKGRYSLSGIPPKFKLGDGHVKFFYDKLRYLLIRYKNLYGECIKRGLNVTDYSEAWDNVPSELFNDYIETPEDREKLLERLEERGHSLI